MKLRQKSNGRFPETHDGNMPKCKVLYLQCKQVIKGVEKGGMTPFSIGNISFDRRRASAFVRGIDSRGFDYIKRNYPVLCEPAI